MKIIRTESEIEAMYDKAREAESKGGTQWTGMTYEEGIVVTLEWLTKPDVESPFEDQLTTKTYTMDNLKLPAYPPPLTTLNVSTWGSKNIGFTKLELASLMVAQGMASNPQYANLHEGDISSTSIAIAKAVLKEVNK